jgi:hypothetical protein
VGGGGDGTTGGAADAGDIGMKTDLEVERERVCM